MWYSLRNLPVRLLNFSERQVVSRRTVYIFRRTHEVPLNEINTKFPKKLEEKSYIYELVEDTNVTKKPPLQLVLLKDVPGVGMLGERIEMNCYAAYRDLLLPKLAAYVDSPEAKKIMRKEGEVQYSSIYCKIIEHYLEKTPIPVIMNPEKPWKLQPWHVKFALRQNGVLIRSNDCVTLPEKEISGPNLEVENKDFIANITMNKKETYPVRCRIYHLRRKEMGPKVLSSLNTPSQPLFPEQKEMIDKIIEKQKERSKIMFSTQSSTQSKKKTKRKVRRF